jgi:hypothetical protein
MHESESHLSVLTIHYFREIGGNNIFNFNKVDVLILPDGAVKKLLYLS